MFGTPGNDEFISAVNDGIGARPLKNGRDIGYNWIVFANLDGWGESMMEERKVRQDALFYEFSLERHLPEKHLLRAIDRFVELDGLRRELEPFYSAMGRPSIDPELKIRMLIVGYCFGIRSERRLCEEVHLNLAYRWFCRLGLDPPSRNLGGKAHDRALAGTLRAVPRAADRRHRLWLGRDAGLARAGARDRAAHSGVR